jgi:hypothetical protein
MEVSGQLHAPVALYSAREPQMNDKGVSVLQLSTTPWRRIGEWRYISTHSWPRHEMEVSGQLHPRSLYRQGRSSRYPLDWRLGGPRASPDKMMERTATAGTRIPDLPACELSIFHWAMKDRSNHGSLNVCACAYRATYCDLPNINL